MSVFRNRARPRVEEELDPKMCGLRLKVLRRSLENPDLDEQQRAAIKERIEFHTKPRIAYRVGSPVRHLVLP